MKKTDIIIFSGQSNMQGETEALPQPNNEIENAFEYRFLSDELIALKHPVGENIGNSLLCCSNLGRGNLVPDFCRAYTEQSGNSVVAIHAARGSTTISDWLKGTDRYNALIEKVKAGIKKTTETTQINKIYLVWLQGESDSINRTSKDDYKKQLAEFKNCLKTEIGINKFCLIEIGYFCFTADFITDRTKEDGKLCDEEIMKAQEELPCEDSDFILLTQITKELSLNREYINPEVDGHYNNKAMTIIGSTAGKALAKLDI